MAWKRAVFVEALVQAALAMLGPLGAFLVSIRTSLQTHEVWTPNKKKSVRSRPELSGAERVRAIAARMAA